jgi:subtilisin family serine protease
VAGVDWVTANAIKPAVANMSLGGGASSALDTAVNNSINSGVTYCIAAGNGNFFGFAEDACNTSPARVAAAVTVSATDNTDTKASWANYGTCVALFAPGVNITSDWYTNTTATNTISGTSMATPHVTGVAALYLETNRTATPATVKNAITSNATTNHVASPGPGTPNLLLYSLLGAAPPPPPPATPDFSLSISPSNATIIDPPGSATYTVNINRTGGFSAGVSLSISGLPAGVTGSFSPNPATANSSTLTVNASASAPTGVFTFTVTGTGGSPSLTRTATASVDIQISD